MISLMQTVVLTGALNLSVNDPVNYLKKPWDAKRLYGAFLLLTREAYVAVGR